MAIKHIHIMHVSWMDEDLNKEVEVQYYYSSKKKAIEAINDRKSEGLHHKTFWYSQELVY